MNRGHVCTITKLLENLSKIFMQLSIVCRVTPSSAQGSQRLFLQVNTVTPTSITCLAGPTSTWRAATPDQLFAITTESKIYVIDHVDAMSAP
jgi:hypothetical protein